MSSMFIDGVRVEFDEIKSLDDFPDYIKKSNFFNSFINQFEKKFRDYHHNTNNKKSCQHMRDAIWDMMSKLSKQDNCDLKMDEYLRIQNIIELAVIGGAITAKFNNGTKI